MSGAQNLPRPPIPVMPDTGPVPMQRQPTPGEESELSPTAMIQNYLSQRGYQPTAENVRRALEANARDPGVIGGLRSDTAGVDPRASGRGPAAAVGGGGPAPGYPTTAINSSVQPGDRPPGTGNAPAAVAGPPAPPPPVTAPASVANAVGGSAVDTSGGSVGPMPGSPVGGGTLASLAALVPGIAQLIMRNQTPPAPPVVAPPVAAAPAVAARPPAGQSAIPNTQKAPLDAALDKAVEPKVSASEVENPPGSRPDPNAKLPKGELDTEKYPNLGRNRPTGTTPPPRRTRAKVRAKL